MMDKNKILEKLGTWIKQVRSPKSDDEGVKPFLEHLEDLRVTLIRCLISLGIAVLVTVPFAPSILRLLQRPLRAVTEHPEDFLRSLEVAGAFSLTVRLCFWSGLLIAIPFLLFFIGQFVFPGLTKLERHVIFRGLFVAVGLFAFGVALGYTITLPVALGVMYRWHHWLGIRPEWVVTDYVVFVIHLLIAFGLAFEMPVVIFILGKIGIVSAEQLKAKRRHAIVGLLVLAMVLTPPDVVTQLIMAVPLILLYEICIYILVATERRRDAEERGDPS